MIKDVNYFINQESLKHKTNGGVRICSINTAVEESTLAMRKDSLLAQDSFIKKYLSDNDYLNVPANELQK